MDYRKGRKMDTVLEKHFSITDPQGVNTVIYRVNKTEKEFAENSPKFTIERLGVSEEIRGELKRRRSLLIILKSQNSWLYYHLEKKKL